MNEIKIFIAHIFFFLFFLLVFSDSYSQIQWITDGIRVSSSYKDDKNPVLVSDSNGGVIIVQNGYGYQNVHSDIFAQKN